MAPSGIEPISADSLAHPTGALDDSSIGMHFFPSPPTAHHDSATSLPLPDREVFDWFSLLNTRPSSEQRFEPILPEVDPNIFEVLNSNAPNTPAWDFWGPLEEPLRGMPSPGLDQSPESLYGAPSDILDGQPSDSHWPHVDKPRSSDVNISLPQQNASTSSAHFPVDWLPEQSRQRLLDTVTRSHQALWPVVDTTNFPSVQTLSACVNFYHRHFQDWLPVINRTAFDIKVMPPLVVLAMAAIGAMYSREGLRGLGEALSELVRRAVVCILESDRRYLFDVNIIQAYLLQTCCGFFSGSQKAFLQAEMSRGALVIATRRMHLLRPGTSAVEMLYGRLPMPSVEELAEAERDDQGRAGLGWAIYMLDSQIACLFNVPAQLFIVEVAAPFPSLSAPHRGNGDSASHRAFLQVLDDFLSNGMSPISLDDFGYSLISYTLYRMCIDAAAQQMIHPPQVGKEAFVLSFPAFVKHHPQRLLSRIAGHTLNIAKTATPLLISCSALHHHCCLQFAFPGLLQKLKVAAGKSGTLDSQLEARQVLKTWINVDPYTSRVVFAHSAMLACLLKRYTFDTPPEAVWTFDAALSIWAVIEFSQYPIAIGPSAAAISWAETPQIEAWIRDGGGVFIHGLGDATDRKSVV